MATRSRRRRLPSNNMASILSIGEAEISGRSLESAINELPDDPSIISDEMQPGPAFGNGNNVNNNAEEHMVTSYSALTNIGVFREDIGDSVHLNINEATGEFTEPSFLTEPEPLKKKGRTVRNKSKTIDALLGQAALLAARSQYEEAMELLREVVRQEPRKPHAYRQIAEIYEMKNDLVRSFEFNLLACHVDKASVAYEWDQVGDMALKLGKLSAAAACYQRAARAANDSWVYYAKRMTVLQEMGNTDMIWRTKLNAMESVDIEKAKLPFNWFKNMMIETIEYFKHTDDEKYLKALTYYVVRCFKTNDEYEEAFIELISNLCDKQLYPQLMNLILSIMKDDIVCYKENDELAYTVRITQAMVTLFPPIAESDAHHFIITREKVTTVLLAQLILSMVKCGVIKCITSLYEELVDREFEPEIEKFYLDIGLSIEPTGDFSQGLYYAKLLTGSPYLTTYANGWYLLGFYKERCSGPEEALDAYYECLKYNVTHVDARISISTILESEGKTEEAIDILKDYNLDGCNRLPDERLLIRQAQMFVTQGKSVEHLRCLRMILIPHFYLVYLKSEQILRQRKSQTNRVVHVNLRRAILTSLSRTPLERLVNRLGAIAERENRDLYSLDQDELHRLSMELISGLSKTNQYQELLVVVGYTFLHPRMPSIHMETFQNLLFYAAIKAENFVLSFEYLRYTHTVITTEKLNDDERKKRLIRLFSAMNYVFSHHQTISMQRYIHRCTLKSPTDYIIRTIAGNNSLTSGSYKNALFEYNYSLQGTPDDPGLHLLISLCFCHLSCRRDITNRLAVARRGIGYMGRYMNLRLQKGPAQEVYYNIGRMFHHFGMVNHAVYWYELVLDEPAPQVIIEDQRTGDGTLIECRSYNLKPVAAYNMSLLLKDSNASYSKNLKRLHCILS